MDMTFILAQADNMTTAVKNDADIVPVDFIWEQISTLTWFQAVLAVSFGVVYLIYGWRIFKVLTVISFGLIGMFVGMTIGKNVGNEMWGGIIGLAAMAILSIPLMKWCICLLGALAGGTLTGAIWYAFGLPQLYMWAGAAVGAVAGGMISFIVFKAAVMLFTSLGGSTIMMTGFLALLHLYELKTEPPVDGAITFVQDHIYNNHWFLPLTLLAPTIFGLFIQHKFIKKSSEWEI